jgi:hypothetical protein
MVWLGLVQVYVAQPLGVVASPPLSGAPPLPVAAPPDAAVVPPLLVRPPLEVERPPEALLPPAVAAVPPLEEPAFPTLPPEDVPLEVAPPLDEVAPPPDEETPPLDVAPALASVLEVASTFELPQPHNAPMHTGMRTRRWVRQPPRRLNRLAFITDSCRTAPSARNKS